MDNPYLPPSTGPTRLSHHRPFKWSRIRGYFVDVIVATAGHLTFMGIMVFFLIGLSAADVISFFRANPALGVQIPTASLLAALGRRLFLTLHFGDSRLRFYLATIGTLPVLLLIAVLLENLLHFRGLSGPPDLLGHLILVLIIAATGLVIEWILIRLTIGRRRF